MKFALVMALPFLANAQTATPVTCSPATLNGTRAVTVTGRQGALSAALQAVGTATFDGVSNVTFNLMSDTISLTNATAAESGAAQTWSGTYTLPSNCVGTVTITSGDTASFILIAYNGGNGFSLTGQDSTYVFAASGSSQPASGCAISTYSGAYTFSATGFSAAGVNTAGGLFQFDGAGNLSGSWSLDGKSAATADTVAGHYSVSAPGCVASATLTDPNNTAYMLNFSISSTNAANFVFTAATAGTQFAGNGRAIVTNPGAAIENAAGTSGAIPPGSLISIYGFGMSAGKSQATSPDWPTTLSSATVLINGEKAPLYYVDNTALGAEGLINAQLPLDIQPGLATVQVQNGSTNSNSVAITVSPTAVPAIFTYGSNHAAAQNFPSYATNSSSAPAAAGTVIVVYFTGGGPVSGQGSLQTGHATPDQHFPVTETATATIGGVSATFDYIGLTPTLIGVYQADIVVPAIAGGDHDLVITVNNVASNSVVISTK